jgi:RNA polymerase sigma-70 factor (ECF subfamily)
MSCNTQSERMLVVRAQARDPTAFRELVTRYERRLVYYLRRMLGDETGAYDVLQDVWLLVFKRLASLEAPEAFRVWLYKIAHDVAVGHLRRRSRQPQALADEEALPEEPDAWNEFEALENAELVHRTLEQLSAPHREVLTLRFLEAMEVAEIAEATGCGIGTVKSRLHYAKRALRQQIEGAGYD